MIDKVENLEFVESEALWGVAHPEHVAPLHLGVAHPEHAAPLLLGAVLLVSVQLDLQLECPRTVGAFLPEKMSARDHPNLILPWGGDPGRGDTGLLINGHNNLVITLMNI